MTEQEALQVLGLSRVPASEQELVQTCNELTVRAQNELTAGPGGAARTAIMDRLEQIRQARLTLLPLVRGQVASGPAQQPSRTISGGPSQGRPSGPSGGTVPPRPCPRASAPSPSPTRYHSPPPRPSVWSRCGRLAASTVGALWCVVAWLVVVPFRTIRWLAVNLGSWHAARRASQVWPPQSVWKRRVALALAAAIVCGVALYRYAPPTASVIVVSFPAADCFVDGAYLTTAPSPEVFEDVAWGWREVSFVTPEGSTHRFHALLLPGQTYRIKANLQDDSHVVAREDDNAGGTNETQLE